LVVVVVVTTTAIINSINNQSTQINATLKAIDELRSKIDSVIVENSISNPDTSISADNNGHANKLQNSVHRVRKQVFFDLGANRGDSSLQFVGIEMSKLGYQVGKAAEDNQFYAVPKRLPGAWDIRMYEGHPKFDEQLYDTEQKLITADKAQYGGPFTVWRNNRTLIGWYDGVIDFYIDTRSSVTWGSSVKQTHPDVSTKKELIKTKMLDLINEITLNYTPEDYVIVKMDIEGAEYDILPALLIRGAFPYIDELYVEFHHFDGADPSSVETKCYRELIFPNALKYYPLMKFGEWS